MEILGKMEMLEKRDGHQGRTFLHPKVHLIKIMKGPVKIFLDQGAAVSKVQFQRFFIFKEQIVSLNLS